MENVKQEKSSLLLSVLKGTLIALSCTLVLILIFAFIIRTITISDGLIKPINQIIKCVSILIGTFCALRKKREMGLIKGLFIGLLFTIVSFVVFSILDGNFDFNKTLINDFFFSGVIGSICGIIAVSVKK